MGSADATRPLGAPTPSAALRLEWQVVRRLDGILQGNYRTVFRGAEWTSSTFASTSQGTTSGTSTGT